MTRDDFIAVMFQHSMTVRPDGEEVAVVLSTFAPYYTDGKYSFTLRQTPESYEADPELFGRIIATIKRGK